MSDKKDKTTRDQALRVARMLGCQGAHETDAGWMPCSSHEEYEGIKKGKEEYLKVRASNNKKPLPKMVQRTKRLETKSDAYYENRADAVAISKSRGCGGVRTVILAGKRYYAVCNHKAPKRSWENLDEKPITGIATLPGGGLVTGSFSGKSLGRPIGGVAEFDGDGDGFSTGPDGEDDIPFSAPVVKKVVSKKVLEILRPTEKFADARKTGRPWKPLTRDGWTPELREKLDKQIQFEKDLAKVIAPWYKKSEPHEMGKGERQVGYALHSIRGMLEGDGWSGSFEDLETQFKQLPKELYESKEAQDVLSFAKKFGAPSYMRMEAWNEWAGLYVDHVIASLEKENVPATHPFYKQMKSAENQNFYNNPYYKFMMRRMTGFEAGGTITQAVGDILRGRNKVDAQAKAEEVVSNPNRRIGLNVGENALDDLLNGGSLKNLFQNNGKNSFIDEYLVQIKDPQIKDRIKNQMETRQIADQMLFGIFGSGNKKENHPLSAFFHPNGVEDVGAWGDAYGKINLVMKKDVEARATMTAGDSLAGNFLGASPLNEPKAIGVEGGWAGMVNNELPNFENSYMNKYFEAQIFGGIEISDVAYVAVPQGFKFENPELEKKLESRGIRVIEVPSRGFVNEPDEIRMKADGKDKTVLIAYSDNSKLYSTGEDTGYIVSDSGKKIKVQSISAVLKFGNWMFNIGDSEQPVQEKGFVNFVSRSTDPDTFSDPESARIRARNLGCIGIRRYTARDGKLVWLPCTNVSDYNRVTGIRGDNSPINNPRRQGSGFKKKSEMDEKALGRSIGGYRRMFKPIGGVGALEDGDGDGFATGADGEDNIPVAKVPKPKTTKPAPKKASPKKKAPKKKLTRAQQRDLDAWNDQVWRNQRERRLANARGYVYAPDADRLAPGAVDWDKAQEVEGHWMSTVDSLEKNSGISKDDKDYAKKKREMMRRAYVETAQKFNLSPKQVQQHMNEVGRQERRPKIITPESLGVRDIMKPRGRKPSEKDAISDGIISYKGVPKPKKQPPAVTSTDINNLAVMVRKNNAKAKTSAKTNLRDLKVVFVRGLTDGGREEANKRVSKFLSLLNSDKPKDVKYSEDNDLLPIDHPWKNRKTAKKWADFEEGEYGVKYAGGCCPKVVKRYRSK